MTTKPPKAKWTAPVERSPQNSETGRAYWDRYEVARRQRPVWKLFLAFFGIHVT